MGRHLIEALKTDYKIIALSRFPKTSTDPNVEWRSCDLYSMGSAFQALRGAQKAIYLVHSMIPKDRLFQAHFSDTDLLVADNFIQACRSHHISQIIYLGGLVPKGYISAHLKSRLEVEELFKGSGIPATLLRAGMVVGPGGSSFEILVNLVRRLRAMILPKWTQRITQTLFIEDLITVFKECLSHTNLVHKTLDLVTGENITYRDLILKSARFQNKKSFFISVPIESKGFSKLWVSIFGGTNYELVSPLIDSLACDLEYRSVDPDLASLIQTKTFDSMLEKTQAMKAKISKHKSTLSYKSDLGASGKAGNTVRSIQRLPSLKDVKAFELSELYFKWLPLQFQGLLRVTRDQESLSFYAPFVSQPLLVLTKVRDEFIEERQKFLIQGGLLVSRKNKGWLEFRVLNHGQFVLSAIHEYSPSLPWYLYVNTQARAHLWVMKNFSNFLSQVAKMPSKIK